MMFKDTRRVQQNPFRWMCLWERRQAAIAARRGHP
jgi:hypothetical protein